MVLRNTLSPTHKEILRSPKEFDMNVGMMWFDNDPRTAITAKVSRAADYYQQKYGLAPNLCLVHLSMLGERPDLVEGCAG